MRDLGFVTMEDTIAQFIDDPAHFAGSATEHHDHGSLTRDGECRAYRSGRLVSAARPTEFNPAGFCDGGGGPDGRPDGLAIAGISGREAGGVDPDEQRGVFGSEVLGFGRPRCGEHFRWCERLNWANGRDGEI